MYAVAKFCTLAYVPPPTLPYAAPFLDNIRRHSAAHDLLLYSDHPWPGVTQLRGSPESIKGDKSYTLSNLLFFTGMALAERVGYTHVLYVEADSRVYGDGWDAAIFREFGLLRRTQPIIGGTIAVHNPCNAGREAALKWERLIINNSKRNYPVATHVHVPVLTFGNKGSAELEASCVFCYGSGTVIEMEAYKALFTEEERRRAATPPSQDHQFGTFGVVSRRPQTPVASADSDFCATQLARECRAWDLELGVRIWKKYGVGAYDVIANLKTVFSSYGNVITTEEERIEMLKDGTRRIIHQCKSGIEI